MIVELEGEQDHVIEQGVCVRSRWGSQGMEVADADFSRVVVGSCLGHLATQFGPMSQ